MGVESGSLFHPAYNIHGQSLSVHKSPSLIIHIHHILLDVLGSLSGSNTTTDDVDDGQTTWRARSILCILHVRLLFGCYNT